MYLITAEKRLLAKIRLYRLLASLLGVAAALTIPTIVLLFPEKEPKLTFVLPLLFGVVGGYILFLVGHHLMRCELIKFNSPDVIGPLAESLYSPVNVDPVDDDGNLRTDESRKEIVAALTRLLSKAPDELDRPLTNRQAGCLYRCLDPVWTEEESHLQLALLDRIAAWRDTRALAHVSRQADRPAASEAESIVKAKAVECRRILEEEAKQEGPRHSLLRVATSPTQQELLIPSAPMDGSAESSLLRPTTEDSISQRSAM